MAIPQSDGSGRGVSAHPYPRAQKDGKFISLGDGLLKCRKSGQLARFKGKRLVMVRKIDTNA